MVEANAGIYVTVQGTVAKKQLLLTYCFNHSEIDIRG